MRAKIGVLLTLLVILSKVSAMEPGPVGNVQYNLYHAEDETYYAELREEHLQFRSKVIRHFNDLRDFDFSDYYVEETTLATKFQEELASYGVTREKALRLMAEHKWAVGKDAKIVVDSSSVTGVVRSGINGNQQTTITINITDPEGAILAKQIKTPLALALVMYDNFLIVMDLIKELQVLLPEINVEIVDQMMNSAYSSLNIESIKKLISYYNLIRKAEIKNNIDVSTAEELDEIIEGSILFQYDGKMFSSLMKQLSIPLNQDRFLDQPSYLQP